MTDSQSPTVPSDRLAGFPFDAHNAEVRALWSDLGDGRPDRTPVILGVNSRFYMMNTEANGGPADWRAYMEDADIMFDAQLRYQRWSRFNLLHDQELGLPEKWVISPDFQNTYEAGWLGCPVVYSGDQVPATHPGFDDCPERVMENGIPDPFGGTLGRGLEFFERYRERAARETFLGRPIEAALPGWGYGTDGPMTVACNCFGASFMCETMAADPDRIHVLFDFLTEAAIRRITAWRERFGHPLKRDGFIYADDSIALISTRMFKEHVLPYHRRMLDALATDAGRGIHLCGDATRHMKTIRDELNVHWFDTGFPVDFGWLRGQVGPESTIQGGPHVDTVRFGTPEEIDAESRRILNTGVLEGGRFVLREGNNLAPGTPPENTEALYRASWKHGLGQGRVKTPAIEWLGRT